MTEVYSFLDTRLSELPGFQHLEGCIELDFCSGLNQPNQWKQTFHGICAVDPSMVSRRRLVGALRSPSMPGMRWPVKIEPVTDLNGALRYAYKGFEITAVTERVTYAGKRPDGRPRVRSRPVRLKPAQQIELIHNLADVGLKARCLLVRPKTRADRQHD